MNVQLIIILLPQRLKMVIIVSLTAEKYGSMKWNKKHVKMIIDKKGNNNNILFV